MKNNLEKTAVVEENLPIENYPPSKFDHFICSTAGFWTELGVSALVMAGATIGAYNIDTYDPLMNFLNVGVALGISAGACDIIGIGIARGAYNRINHTPIRPSITAEEMRKALYIDGLYQGAKRAIYLATRH